MTLEEFIIHTYCFVDDFLQRFWPSVYVGGIFYHLCSLLTFVVVIVAVLGHFQDRLWLKNA